MTLALNLHKGIHAMARFTGRVAAMAAVAALLSQAACTIGFTSMAHLEVAESTGSGCHETAPATPSTPDREHVCCGGNHSPDALLTTAYMAALPMVSQTLQVPTFDMATPGRPFASIVSHPYSPPGPFVLRI